MIAGLIIVLLLSFGVLAAGLMKDILKLEQIGIVLLTFAVIVISCTKVKKLWVGGGEKTMEDIKIPKKKKKILGIIAFVLGIILAGEFFAMFLNSQTKPKKGLTQKDIPNGKPAATATMLIVMVLLFSAVLFFYNIDYYLMTPDTMWVIIVSFLFVILMVMILGIIILKEYALLKYNTTNEILGGEGLGEFLNEQGRNLSAAM